VVGYLLWLVIQSAESVRERNDVRLSTVYDVHAALIHRRSAVYAHTLSVRLSVSLSVTLVYCIETG